MSKRRSQRRKWRSLYVWHRTMGLVAALMAIALSLTGIALNHGNGWQLDQHYVTSDWLLDLYQIQQPTAFASYKTPQGHISQVGERIYLERDYLHSSEQSLIGAIWHQQQWIIALESSVLILSQNGELIEHQNQSSGLPELLLGIGQTPNKTLIVDSGRGFYASDSAILNWHRTTDNSAQWMQPVAAPPELRQHLGQDFRQHLITWERFLYDLHSGRLFGAFGVFLVDLSGLLILLLALSGFWIWFKQRTKHH